MTYIVYLTATNASSDEENRNPNTDTVSLEHVAVGSYVDSQLNLPVAKVVVDSNGNYESHVDLHTDGTGLMRVDSLRAFGGSDIHIYAGDFPQDSLVAEFRTDKFMTASNIDVDVGGDLNVTGDSNLSNIVLDSVTISTIQTSAETFVDNDTSFMTSAAILDKIQEQVTAEDLDVSGDLGTIAIDLDSETLTIEGAPMSAVTTNASGNSLQINVSVHDSPNNGSSTTPISSNWAYDHLNSGSFTHHTKYALTEDLDSGEINQLKNIGSTTISSTNWGYVGDLDGHLGLGSGNTDEILSVHNPQSGTSVYGDNQIQINTTGTVQTYFWIPLPLTRGTKNLHISGISISVKDADTNSYIHEVRAAWLSNVSFNISTSTSHRNTTDINTSVYNYPLTFTAKEMVNATMMMAGVRVSCTKASGYDLRFFAPKIKYYYA